MVTTESAKISVLVTTELRGKMILTAASVIKNKYINKQNFITTLQSKQYCIIAETLIKVCIFV